MALEDQSINMHKNKMKYFSYTKTQNELKTSNYKGPGRKENTKEIFLASGLDNEFYAITLNAQKSKAKIDEG